MDRQVRCNHCMVVSLEEDLVIDDTAVSGERCPSCGKSDALMDVDKQTKENKQL